MPRSVRFHRVVAPARALCCLVALVFAVAMGSAATPVLAQGAPPNDDFDSAVTISTLPFNTDALVQPR